MSAGKKDCYGIRYRPQLSNCKDVNTAMMTNYEVMTRLRKDKGRKGLLIEQLATVTYEAIKYLETLPSKSLQPDAILACLKALAPYKLTKNELIMIVNTPPSSPLEMQLIVFEEDRLNDQQVEEIIQIVKDTLIVPCGINPTNQPT